MMKRLYSLLLFSTMLFVGCQSVEQLSIDYMLPAEVSFPPVLKKVAVVNNMPDIPDNQLIVKEPEKKKNETEVARQTKYFNGDAQITTEALAAAIAEQNYFDEVVICDSALRVNDITPRESTLSKNEVEQLTRNLGVDFLIALENIQIRSIRKVDFIPDWGVYEGTLDVKVYPTVRIYLPQRSGPMVTVNSSDSIFWDAIDRSMAYVNAHLIDDKNMLKEASEFAGTVPVKRLLPYWSTGYRYLFTGGSVNMRDAAVFVREENWDDAIKLWKEVFDTKKKGKQKMYAAYNLALGYEMKDSIDTAEEWALKAQAIAYEIDKIEEKKKNATASMNDIPNYFETTRYLSELKERKEGMQRLNIQMQRFKDDF